MNYSYPSTNSKLSSVGADSYSYDAMGNITDDDALAYTWSAAALLKEVKTSGTSTVLGTYTYDASNLRTKKVAGGNTVHYVYGLGGLLYGEYDNSGALIREYVWLNGEPLAQVDAGSPEVLTYLHTDHLATPRYGTNAGGSTVWTWESGAFGKEAATGRATVNLRFPGQYRDAETGLHYNWNRYYNPAIGRYVSSDPIGLAGGLDKFSYADLSPATLVDPDGLIASKVCKLFKYCKDIVYTPIKEAAKKGIRWCIKKWQERNKQEEAEAPPEVPEPGESGAEGAGGTDGGNGSGQEPKPEETAGPTFSSSKNAQKWENQLKKRGWTKEQVKEAIDHGKKIKAENNINPANGATRHVHPQTGQSVVTDNATGEVIHVGGPGFAY
ncbi:MAG: hypothetical protein KJ017_08600 [Alphaproteobacteria bacterium]|nr:hypothetical protein [Alphaproteobacteria bacterium]